MKISETELESMLELKPPRPWWRRPATWLLVLAAISVLIAIVIWRSQHGVGGQPQYVSENVTRGHLIVTVTANGTLQPTNKVDIGSELSGTVARVLVDLNDRVTKGQALAELDTEKLRDQVARSKAGLTVAEAKVRQADATRGGGAGQPCATR